MDNYSEFSIDERIYYRDQLRAGRYAALADAEGFYSICFALGILCTNPRLMCLQGPEAQTIQA